MPLGKDVKLACGLVVLIGLVATVLLGVAATLLYPGYNTFKERAKRVTCSNNLKQIGLASLFHAEEHDGNFPEKLSDTFLYIEEYDVYICPSREHQATMTRPEDIDTMSDYVYVKGRKASDDPDSIVAYDKYPCDDGLNVLFVNGRVEWTPLDRFRELAKKQGLKTELGGGVGDIAGDKDKGT